MSGEQNVIHWGERVFVIDGDNELAAVIDGLTREEWLDAMVVKFVECVQEIRLDPEAQIDESKYGRLIDVMTFGLLDFEFQRGAGRIQRGLGGDLEDAQISFQGRSDTQDLLRWVAASTVSANGLEALAYASDYLLDNKFCWALFDEPVGEVEQYAEELAGAPDREMARLALQQQTLELGIVEEDD